MREEGRATASGPAEGLKELSAGGGQERLKSDLKADFSKSVSSRDQASNTNDESVGLPRNCSHCKEKLVNQCVSEFSHLPCV